MKSLRNFGTYIWATVINLIGCSKEVTGDAKIAKEYVETQGYTITSYKGQVDKYILEKSKLSEVLISVNYTNRMWGCSNKIDP